MGWQNFGVPYLNEFGQFSDLIQILSTIML
jgi:hypothetical protein